MKVAVLKDVDIRITGATLLSYEEAETLLTEKERMYDERWWLRSGNPGTALAHYVERNGRMGHINGINVRTCFSVRPVLQIEPGPAGVKKGDSFIFKELLFSVISDSLALCTGCIGTSRFNENNNAGDGVSDYEVSDVKKDVDRWFGGDSETPGMEELVECWRREVREW